MNNINLSRIQNNPIPLINGDNKIVFFWSAKAGCTFILKWFYFQNSIKVGNEAIGLQDYRANIYYNSPEYKAALNDYLHDHTLFKYVKFIRNPYERAVSSYLHFLKKAKTNDVMARNFLNVERIDNDFKFSFKEFIEVLSTKQINLCNVHWRCQLHPLEKTGLIKIDHIIDLKESINSIPLLEKKYNLKISGKQMLSNFKNRVHHSKKLNQTVHHSFIGHIQHNWLLSENRPPFSNFYNKDLKRRIYNIYIADFKQYNIPK